MNYKWSFVSIKALTNPNQKHLIELKELAEKGNVRPYIDKSFPLSEIMAAHEYADKGREKGNVVIEIIN
ncbi:zinc-binding dehydrogenase [Psychroserpens ponticola]|uniref:zinc-binding dehydrogenase n=1 Tax=Psychroserpens ponticola TaxID=2932268 RepID=UPI003742292C